MCDCNESTVEREKLWNSANRTLPSQLLMVSRTAHPLSERINWFCHFLLPIHLTFGRDRMRNDSEMFVVTFQLFRKRFVISPKVARFRACHSHCENISRRKQREKSNIATGPLSFRFFGAA